MASHHLKNHSLPQTQSAITMTEFGQPDVLKYRSDVDLPTLKDNQVMIKIAYAGVNPVDYKTRQGLGWGADNIKNNQFANNQPAILGFDMAGEVVQSNSQRFAVGDRVAALNFEGGGYAEYNVVDTTLLATVPDRVSLQTAGAIPCVGTTAYQLLNVADIKAGEHVVMSAPAGGVGHLVLQMLMDKVAQDGVKLTLICSAEKYQKIQQIIDVSKLEGWIDYTKNEPFPQLNADLLLDLVGDEAGVQALPVLKEGGRVVVLPSIWVDKLQQAGREQNLQVAGFVATPNGADLAEVIRKVDQGKLTLHIQSVYPLQDAAQAHREIEQGDSFGKSVLEI